MKRPVLLLALFAALPVMADGVHFNSDLHHRCAMNIHSGIKLDRHTVTLTDQSGQQWHLNKGELRLNDRFISLSSLEQQRVRELENDLREIVPRTAEITHEGLAMGKEAVTSAFAALLGPEDNSVARIKRKFSKLEDDVKKRVTANELPADKFDHNGDLDLLGDGASLGMTIGAATLEFLGDVVKAVFDKEYAHEMEMRAKKMEQEIESRVEMHSKILDKKADALCEIIEHAHGLQSQLNDHPDVRTLRVLVPKKPVEPI